MTTFPLFEAHDAEWLRLSALTQKAEYALASRTHTVIYVAGWKKNFGRNGSYVRLGEYASLPQALPQAIAWCEAHGNEWAIAYSGKVSEQLDAYNAAVIATKAAYAAVAAHELGYTGWSRYWLVTSSNGLIHRSTHCSTCNKGRQSTEFALLPSLSGADFASAVEALGPSLCSVCFSEAPTSVVDGPKLPSRITSLLFTQSGQSGFWAELAKYNAKRAAKAAAK